MSRCRSSSTRTLATLVPCKLFTKGIRRCAYHSVLIGLVSGLVDGIVAGGFTEVITGVQDPKQLWPLVLTYGLIVGSFTGVIGGLRQCVYSCQFLSSAPKMSLYP